MTVAPGIDQRTELQKEVDRNVRQRVLDGIELLKKKHGEGWVDHINLEELDLTSGECCVLGQLYGHRYGDGIEDLGITGNGGNYGFDSAFIDGAPQFVLAHMDDDMGYLDDGWSHWWYEQLQEAWQQEISYRKSLRA